MNDIKANYEVEIRRLQKRIAELDPESDEYAIVQERLMRATDKLNDMVKNDDSRKGLKVDTVLRVATLLGTVVVAPCITYKHRVNLTEIICKLEQVDSLISTPGKSIGSWFRDK